MEKLTLSSPWVLYYRLLQNFFKEDPDVEVKLNEEEGVKEIKLYVEGVKKADALTALLPATKQFGNVLTKIIVVPANVQSAKFQLLQDALEGNDAVSFFDTEYDPFTGKRTDFVVFNKEVVQYYIDDMMDLWGCKSALYEDMAREIFEGLPGVFFCTDVDDPEGLLRE